MKKILAIAISVLAVCSVGLCIHVNALQGKKTSAPQTSQKTENSITVLNESSSQTKDTFEEHNNSIVSLSFDEIDAKVQIGIQRFKNGEKNTSNDGLYTSQQEVIYHKMLNSVDYFNTAEGTVVNADTVSIDNPVTIDYQLDNTTASGYFKQTDKQGSYNLEGYTSNNNTIEVNNINQSTTSYNTECEDFVLSDNYRLMKNENGELVSISRPGAEATGMAKSLSIFAQGVTLNFMSDFDKWSISANSVYLGRECTEITGTPCDSYQQKGVVSYKLWVDTQTGILLKYEGYSSDGTLAEYTTTESISIDNNISIKEYNQSEYSNYTEK